MVYWEYPGWAGDGEVEVAGAGAGGFVEGGEDGRERGGRLVFFSFPSFFFSVAVSDGCFAMCKCFRSFLGMRRMTDTMETSPVDKTIQSLEFHQDVATLHAAG